MSKWINLNFSDHFDHFWNTFFSFFNIVLKSFIIVFSFFIMSGSFTPSRFVFKILCNFSMLINISFIDLENDTSIFIHIIIILSNFECFFSLSS